MTVLKTEAAQADDREWGQGAHLLSCSSSPGLWHTKTVDEFEKKLTWENLSLGEHLKTLGAHASFYIVFAQFVIRGKDQSVSPPPRILTYPTDPPSFARNSLSKRN